MFYVYYLQSTKDSSKFYVGYSTDLQKRLVEHNVGKSASTKPYRSWKLIFYEGYISKVDTKRRETYFKTTQGRKALKLVLRDTLK